MKGLRLVATPAGLRSFCSFCGLDFSKPSSEIESRRIKKGETAPGNTRGRFTTRRYTKRRLVLMVADASSDWQLSRRFFILPKQHQENLIGDL
jgi:hypothetical protein